VELGAYVALSLLIKTTIYLCGIVQVAQTKEKTTCGTWQPHVMAANKNNNQPHCNDDKNKQSTCWWQCHVWLKKTTKGIVQATRYLKLNLWNLVVA